MSKGNLFLGQARGSVGDVTFTVFDGKQIARARNRQPRNPKVVSQMVSRIVLNTVSKAYSRMQAICDHAFESRSGKARNQQRFQQLNIAMLRDYLSAVIADPTEQKALDSLATSFSFKDDFQMSINPYYISEGTLRSLNVEASSTPNSALKLMFPAISGTAPTYQEIVDALGVQRGDQLTFVGLSHDYSVESSYDQANDFVYARIILEPADGDMSKAFLTGTQGNMSVNDPNPKNEGEVFLELGGDGVDTNYIEFGWDIFSDEETNLFAAGAVILSRFEDGKWRRSSQRLVYVNNGPVTFPLGSATFGLAYASYLNGDSSGLYLNGSPTAAAAAPGSAAVITSIMVDGDEVYQHGYAQVENNTEVVINGTNLQSGLYVRNRITREIVTPHTISDTLASYNSWTTDNQYDIVLNNEEYAVIACS